MDAPMIMEVGLRVSTPFESVTSDIMPIAMDEPITSTPGISPLSGLSGGGSILICGTSMSRLKRGDRLKKARSELSGSSCSSAAGRISCGT